MEETTKTNTVLNNNCSTVLQFLAAISIIAGVFMALIEFSEKYIGEWMWAVYVVSGFISGVYFWALSIIVKAAEKYLSKNE